MNIHSLFSQHTPTLRENLLLGTPSRLFSKPNRPIVIIWCSHWLLPANLSALFTVCKIVCRFVWPVARDCGILAVVTSSGPAHPGISHNTSESGNNSISTENIKVCSDNYSAFPLSESKSVIF